MAAGLYIGGQAIGAVKVGMFTPDGSVDTSDATAIASDILSGKTAYVNGTKVTGSIQSKSAAIYTPGTADQTIASGQYLSGAQTIQGDTNLVASNIKSGVSIFGVEGSHVCESGIDTSDATATASDIAKDVTAYVNGEKITGKVNVVESGKALLGPSSTLPQDGTDYDAVMIPVTIGNTYGYLFRSGAIVKAHSKYENFGDAAASDVLSGKTFTSSAGLKVIGTHTCSGGVNTSDATASATDILSGKTAYVNGSKITGSIETKSASDLTASGKTVTVPAGYYASSTSKDVNTVEQAVPSISIDSSGVVSATCDQSEGYVSAGGTMASMQLTTQSAQTITPGTANKTIPSGTYLTGVQTISGDANLVASNIKSGVSIFGVTGTYAGSSSSGSSMTMKTGTTTSATIDTGLSNISAIVIYKDSLRATGLIQGVYITDEDTLHYTYCSQYSSYYKTCATSTSTASSVSGGTFTLGTSGTSGLSSSTTYNWVAFGTE